MFCDQNKKPKKNPKKTQKKPKKKPKKPDLMFNLKPYKSTFAIFVQKRPILKGISDVRVQIRIV